MGAESLTNARTNLPNVYTNVTAREIDFVTRFNKNWDDLREILGIMRPIKKAPGTRLVAYKAKVTLESGDVQPGCVIPYSQTQIEQVGFEDLTIKKYAKAVPVEDLDLPDILFFRNHKNNTVKHCHNIIHIFKFVSCKSDEVSFCGFVVFICDYLAVSSQFIIHHFKVCHFGFTSFLFLV